MGLTQVELNLHHAGEAKEQLVKVDYVVSIKICYAVSYLIGKCLKSTSS